MHRLFRRFPNEGGVDDRLSDKGDVGGFSRDTPPAFSLLEMGWARLAVSILPALPPQSIFTSDESSFFKAWTIAGKYGPQKILRHATTAAW